MTLTFWGLGGGCKSVCWGQGGSEVVVITGVPLLAHSETLNNSTMAAAAAYIDTMLKEQEKY